MKFPGVRAAARIAPALFAVAALAAVVTGCSAVDDATKSEVAKTQVGDCLQFTNDSITDAKGEGVDCSSQQAVYKVVSTANAEQPCPSEDYTTYTEDMVSGGVTFMCLAPNFKQDSCYNAGGAGAVKWADCASADATVKVVQRIDGETDEMLCGDTADQFLAIPDPKTLFCMTSV